MADFHYLDAALGPLFEESIVRGYEMTIASSGNTERHKDRYDRLLVALTDIQLADDSGGGKSAEIRLTTGEIEWMPGPSEHRLTNTGTHPARFIILEFR